MEIGTLVPNNSSATVGGIIPVSYLAGVLAISPDPSSAISVECSPMLPTAFLFPMLVSLVGGDGGEIISI